MLDNFTGCKECRSEVFGKDRWAEGECVPVPAGLQRCWRESCRVVAVNEPAPVTSNEHDCFQELKT